MNWKTTLLLVVLLAAGTAAYFYFDSLQPEATSSPTVDFLDKTLKEEKLTRLEIRHGSQRVDFARGADKTWVLPGGWPMRDIEVRDFVQSLTQLQSRFAPIPLATSDAKELKKFGLDNDPLQITVTLDGKEYRLQFGQEPGETNRFSRPTYLRLNDHKEVLRLGPSAFAALDRNREYFQKPRLFAFQRVAKEKKSAVKVEQVDAGTITVTSPEGEFTLTRKKAPDDAYLITGAAADWELSKPFRDRIDPDKLEGMLIGVADLWAEKFIDERGVQAAFIAGKIGGFSEMLPGLAGEYVTAKVNRPLLFHGLFEPRTYQAIFLAATVGQLGMPLPCFPGQMAAQALDRPAMAQHVAASPAFLTVTKGKDPLILMVGGRSPRKGEDKVTIKAPFPGGKPEPMVIPGEEYRFAKIKGNDQLFEIKSANMRNLLISARALRDSRLARFKADEVARLEIRRDGADLVFVSEKEKPKDPGDDKDKEPKYRWRMLKPESGDVDGDEVAKLVSQLASAEVKDADIIDPDLKNPHYKKDFGLDAPAVLTVEIEEGRNDKDAVEKKSLVKKRFAFRLSFKELDKSKKEKEDKGKVYVQREGWDRINILGESLWKLASRPAVAYRSRKLLDFVAADLANLKIQRGGDKGETINLTHDKDKWRLTKPVSAEVNGAKPADLAVELGRLEAVEFITDKPGKDDLEKVYGLDKPAVTVNMTFAKANKGPHTLLIGKQRKDKDDYYSRLDNGPIFALKKEVFETAAKDSLAYRSLDLWKIPEADIAEVKIKTDKDDFALKRVGKAWRIAGPFDAPTTNLMEEVADHLSNLRRERFVALQTDKPADFGFDKPTLRLTLLAGKDKGPFTLIVGKRADPKSHFAQLEGDPAVFTIGSVATTLATTPFDWLERELLNINANSIQEIRTTGKIPFTLQRPKEEWQITDAPIKFAPDGEAVKEAVAAWSRLHVAKFAGYGPMVNWDKYGLKEPAVTVIVKAGDKEHTLAFGNDVPGQPGQVYARFDKHEGLAILDAATVRNLKRTHFDYVNRQVLRFDFDAITAFSRFKGKNKEEEFRLVKVDDAWNLEKPVKTPADALTLDKILSQMFQLRARRIEAYPFQAADLKRCGLDEPEYTVVLTLGGDSPMVHRLQIGGVADAASGERYALLILADKPDNKIFVLPGDLSRLLTASPLNFRDRNLASFSSTDKLVYERGDRKAVFLRGDDKWKMTEPVKTNVEDADLEEFLRGLYRLRADEIVAEKPAEKKPFGLDPPAMRCKFFNGDKVVLDIAIGKQKDDRCYAQLAGSDLVFLLSPKLTQAALREFRDRKVWPPLDAAQIEKVSFAYDGKPTFALQKAGPAWRVVGQPDILVNALAVTDTLDALAGLQALHYIADKNANLQLYGLAPTPALSIKIETKTGDRILHIGRQEGDSGRVYATVAGAEGSPVFVISENITRRIMRHVQAFKE